MQLSDADVQTTVNLAVKFIQLREGFREQAYPDPISGGDPWTLGWGFTAGVGPDDTTTLVAANEKLTDLVGQLLSSIEGMLDPQLTANQLAALVDFAYNEGLHALANSTLLKIINGNGSSDDIEREFLRWDYAGGKQIQGLENRRQLEWQLYSTGAVA
jgi:lysozyme